MTPPSSDPGARFREAGLPYTPQRRAIWESLATRTDHPTADEVLAGVAPSLPGISRTTVYRTLEAMVRIGLVARVPHPGAASRYDPKTHRHHHLVCDGCGAVQDLEDPALSGLDLPDERLGGFRVRDYSVQLSGLCASCSKD